MQILLNLNWRKMKKVGRMAKYTAALPLELIYISCGLDRKKISNKILDLWGLNKEIKDFRNEIKDAEIILLNTAQSYVFWRDGLLDAELPKEAIKEIRQINEKAKIILIGPQGTAIPETFFDTKIDYIITGEPDTAAVELIKDVLENKDIKLKCVCYKKDGKWVKNKEYALVEDLDELNIDYTKINLDNYTWQKPPHLKINKIAIYESSRGCTFNCAFCFREGFRGKFRLKSLEKVKRELKELARLGIDYLYLIDENFGINWEHSKEVCKELHANNIRWACQIRDELLNEERIGYMAKNGCKVTELGLEAVNKQVQKNIGKETIDVEKLKKDALTMIKEDIHPTINLIIGSPGETKKTIEEMTKYALGFPLDKVCIGAFAMTPYPKTKIWELGLKEGRRLETWDDVIKNLGVIGNDFKSVKKIEEEVIRFNMRLRKKKYEKMLFGNIINLKITKIPLSLINYAASSFIIKFPQSYETFKKTYYNLK